MFKKAVAVFAEDREREKNYHLVLRQEVDSLKDTVLYITAFSFYRLTVNGNFVFFGPARTALGYARVDEISLDEYDKSEGVNEIIIEVNGYYCKSLSTCRQPSFVAAELRRGEDVIAYTGRDFEGYRSARMLQKVDRYSAQRHFAEVWDHRGGLLGEEVKLAKQNNGISFIPRVAPMPSMDLLSLPEYSSAGVISYDEALEASDRYSFDITEDWGRYTEEDVEYSPYRWISKRKFEKRRDGGALPLSLSEGEYAVIDMGRMECGFICLDVKAHADSDIVVGFSEMCSPERFEFTNMNARNASEHLVGAGQSINAISFEPYTCRMAVIMVKKGSITLSSFGICRFEYSRADILERRVSDPVLREIYDAAVSTFVHNALDIYMDCPSRERAGWLCDSFFTGRAEYFLTGKTVVEDAFLENYRLYKQCGEYPEGALPMCYPSDPQWDHAFIPQWNMWYIIEVKEYLTERKPSVNKELFRDSVYGVLRFLERHENADGLLQDLPSWNFVEWSTANEWVKNVNYPTNFLYAEVLRSIGELYGERALIEKGNRVAETARTLSFDGEVFVDNAELGEDGRLHNTRNSSEAGQYYALLFGNVDMDSPKYARLKAHVMNGFEAFDTAGRGFVPVNAFIGFYLRICALMKLGEKQILAKDIKRFFGGMTMLTGTLWEYKVETVEGESDFYKSKRSRGSCDHGFASFAAVAVDFIEN